MLQFSFLGVVGASFLGGIWSHDNLHLDPMSDQNADPHACEIQSEVLSHSHITYRAVAGRDPKALEVGRVIISEVFICCPLVNLD